MAKTLRLSFLISLVLIAPACRTATPDAATLSDEKRETLHNALQRYIDDDQLAGSVILVTQNGKETFHEALGFRDLESQAPMRKDTIFRIASQSKALVSVATMMLEEEGLLALTDPVGKFLPEFMQTTVAVSADDGTIEVVPAERPITVFDLLTHTTGIGYGGGGPAEKFWAEAGIQGWYFADREEPIAATVSRMAAVPFDAQPGEEFVYGYSTDILGVVVEQVSGQSLDVFLRERLFEPLRMHDTHFYLPRDKRDRLATVYSSADGGIVRAPDAGSNAQGAYVEGPRVSFSGGAGLLSTAYDYTRFLQMLLNGGVLGDVRVLSAEAVERMSTVQYPWDDNAGFGLGFAVAVIVPPDEPGSPGQYGWGGAYHSIYWVDPAEEMTVVYLTQLIPAEGIDDHDRVRGLVDVTILDP